MPSLHIRQFPDPILRKVADPIRKIDRNIELFINSLIKFMKSQPGGVGIAATQVGVLKQLAIVDVSSKIPGSKLLILINPIILASGESGVFREGCMSLPDHTANVTRAERVAIKYQDIGLKTNEMTVFGLQARCIQHEVDHLHGKLFLDRVTSLKSDVFRRKRYL